jgi:cell division septation protein DedD
MKKIQFQMGFGGLFAIFLSSLLILVWIFILGFWAGQKFIKGGGKDLSQLSMESSQGKLSGILPEKKVSTQEDIPDAKKEELVSKEITTESLPVKEADPSSGSGIHGKEEGMIKEEKIEIPSAVVQPAPADEKKKEVSETRPEKIASVQPSVKKTEKPAEPPKESAKKESKSYHALQIASFKDIAQASHEVSRWQEKGYDARYLKADLGEKGVWYRVYVGKFDTPEEARSFQKIITKKEGVKAYISTLTQ